MVSARLRVLYIFTVVASRGYVVRERVTYYIGGGQRQMEKGCKKDTRSRGEREREGSDSSYVAAPIILF